MKLLLDTHCWLWAMQAPERLNERARKWIEDPGTEVFFSAASAWEISIKHALGKLRLPIDAEDYIATRVREERFTELAIGIRHASRVSRLPKHHRDPFDRILIAQAQIEGLPILTVDQVFSRYEVKVIRAD